MIRVKFFYALLTGLFLATFFCLCFFFSGQLIYCCTLNRKKLWRKAIQPNFSYDETKKYLLTVFCDLI